MANTKKKRQKNKKSSEPPPQPQPPQQQQQQIQPPTTLEIPAGDEPMVEVTIESPDSPRNDDEHVVVEFPPETYRTADYRSVWSQLEERQNNNKENNNNEHMLAGYGVQLPFEQMEVDYSDDCGDNSTTPTNYNNNDDNGDTTDDCNKTMMERDSAPKVQPQQVQQQQQKGSCCSSDNSTCTDTATEDEPPALPPQQQATVPKNTKKPVKTYSRTTTVAQTPTTTSTTNSLPRTVLSTKELSNKKTSPRTVPSTTTHFNLNQTGNGRDSSLLLPNNNDRFNRQNEFCFKKMIENTKCAAHDCKNVAKVKCPTCFTLQYCTDKHRRTAYKSHEMFCNPYRLLETTPLGRHAIAAREIAKGSLVMLDEPIAQMPCNVSSAHSTVFPNSYCIACFTMHEIPGKTQLCDCFLSVCINTSDCSSNQQLGLFPTYLNVGHVECEKIRMAQEAHMKEEAAKLEQLGLNEMKPAPLVIDQNIVWMVRLAFVLKRTEKHNLIDQFNQVKLPPPSKEFLAKLRFIREKVHMTKEEMSDEKLHQIYIVMRKQGRVIGKDVVTYYNRETKQEADAIDKSDGRHWKGVFALLPTIHHSCVPNSVIFSTLSHTIGVHALQPLKKGEVITICFDERSLYYPTFKRRAYLNSEFGITCNCKRCTSPTELNTYFSSFPCSNCGPQKRLSQGNISSSNPSDLWAKWICSGCKKQCNALRVFDLVGRMKDEVQDFLDLNDVFGLNSWLKKVVEFKVVHWNHFVVWDACVLMFKLLWKLLLTNDTRTILTFNQSKGLEFLHAADVLIHLTSVFQPYTYMEGLVMPLRLAAIIKLRELTNKLSQNELTIQKVDSAINSIYRRARGTNVPVPLYKWKVARDEENRTMRSLELKMLANVYGATKLGSSNVNMTKLLNAPNLDDFMKSFYEDDKETFDNGIKLSSECMNPFVTVLADQNVRRKAEVCIFPWALEV